MSPNQPHGHLFVPPFGGQYKLFQMVWTSPKQSLSATHSIYSKSNHPKHPLQIHWKLIQLFSCDVGVEKWRSAVIYVYVRPVPSSNDSMCKKVNPQTSSQDGGIGRYTLHARITKRSTTTNLKTKNNQKCQKIELYGSLTTKELKKKHSSRLVGGAEMASQGREDSQQVGGWWTQRGGGLWNEAGSVTASRPRGPTFAHR